MVFGQESYLGTPFIQSYSKDDYASGLHNWEIGQDKRGIMYFANDAGLLVHDGRFWNTYSIPNRTTFRSLVIAPNGIIYGGAQNEIGYFKPNDNGLWIFHSLKEKIPEQHREFEDVWDIIFLNDAIFFRSSGKVFKYENDTFDVTEQLDVQFIGKVGNEICVHDVQEGTYFLRNGEYVDSPIGQHLIGNEVEGVIPMDGGYIVPTKEKGIFYIYNGEKRPWNPTIQTYLKENKIESIAQLPNEQYGIGTIYGGLLIVNKEGEVLQHIDKEDGLPSNSILSQYIDKDNNLWIGLDKGIAYLQVNSEFTRIFPDGSLEGAGYTAKVHKGILYLGTNNGLYATPLEKNTNQFNYSTRFRLVSGTKNQTWGLDIVNDQLILSHSDGASIIEEYTSRPLVNSYGYWLFNELEHTEHPIVAGTYEGISFYNKGNNAPSLIMDFKGFNESSRFVEEDRDGNIWVAHPYKGIYRISTSKGISTGVVTLLGQADGLPSNLHNHLFKIGDEIIFCGEYGTYNYDPQQRKFIPNTSFNEIFGEQTKIRRLSETENGNIWFITDKEVGFLNIDDLGVDKKINKVVYPELQDLLIGGFESMYPYNEKNVFIGAEKGFIHFQPKKSVATDSFFEIIMHEIAITQPTRIPIFHGNYWKGEWVQSVIDANGYLPYSNNALSFHYSATSFEHQEYLKFRYQLQGYHDEWSDWSSQRDKEYTNLSPGQYVFMVQAKDYQGIETPVYVYVFTVAPPWYLSTWAFILYGLLLLALVYLLTKFLNKRYQDLEEDHEKILQQTQEEINKLKSEKMELELEHKKRALVSSTLLLVKKNETLAEIKDELSHLKKETINSKLKPKINKLIHKLQQNEILDEGWEQFMLHFNELHGDFLKRLKKQYPSLTPKDLKLCGYLRMNLNTKEIASLMNVSVRGVEASRYRLRKKIDLDSSENLTEFFMNY